MFVFLLKQVYENKHEYNLEVVKLRDKKIRLIEEVKKIHERLGEIRVEIPPALVKAPPAWPEIDEETEFPERHLEVCYPIVVFFYYRDDTDSVFME